MSNEESCCAQSAQNCCNENDSKPTAEQNALRDNVREMYARVANTMESGACGGEEESSCCGSSDEAISTLISSRLGYSQADIDLTPEGADMGLGCGNPKAIAAIQKGEVVVDLGSGGGIDCFLASPQTGETGRVIGIDMTPDMISKARLYADKGNFDNVEFRLGEIENIPVADSSVDVIISNCVINLSPDKPQVFKEAYRILKSGGRIAISDVVATLPLPEELQNDPLLIAGCMGNAALIEELQADLEAAGFTQISITPKDESRAFLKDWAPDLGVENYIVSASIQAVKPAH